MEDLWNQIENDLGFNDKDMRRDRPHTGQPQTDTGERGKTEVRGITFRDLRDCYIRAFFLASAHVNKEKHDEADQGEFALLCENDLYGWDLNEIDPMAVFQNMSCEVERLMGIFPNVPPLMFSSEEE